MSVHEEHELRRLLLTPEEAAHALGIGRSKVYELMLTSALDSVKIGTHRRIPLRAVEAYIAALTTDDFWCRDKARPSHSAG